MYKTTRNITVLGVGLSISAAVGWLLLKEAKRDKEPSTLRIMSQKRATAPAEIAEIVLPLDDEALNEAEEPASEPAPTPAAPVAATPDQSTQEPDDLTRIKDIGPRFAEALAQVGITRFEQLAQQDPDALAEQLGQYATVRAQRIRDKAWIAQAAQLAAE